MLPKHHEINRKKSAAMLEADVIALSSFYSSFWKLICKKEGGELNFFVDHHTWNGDMREDRWPLPQIEELIDERSICTGCTTMNQISRYQQVSMTGTFCDMKTVFARYGTHTVTVMRFLLVNALASLLRVMRQVMTTFPILEEHLEAIVTFSRSLDDNPNNLKAILKRISSF